MTEIKGCLPILLISIALIDFNQAMKLCEFAEKFPCKGNHCYQQDVITPRATAKAPTTTVEASPKSTVNLCPPNMVYGTCSRTCKDPHCCDNVSSSDLTCVCDKGFYMNGTHCVNEKECPCYHPTVGIIKDGESHANANCTTLYSCINKNLVLDRTYKCHGNATCANRDGVQQCYCNDGFGGDGMICLQRDCHDLFITGSTTDGVYTIYPIGWESTGFQVYCEMSKGGGGWTVFQRRATTSEIFQVNWNDYKIGFGNVAGDHWLGNDKLHALTNQASYKLQVDMRYDAGIGTMYTAIYDYFHISNETNKYRLTLGSYNGTAGDSLSDENGSQFSTIDQDNDNDNVMFCAKQHQGGWWYTATTFPPMSATACFSSGFICSKANLNGLIMSSDGMGTYWSTLSTSSSCIMKETNMKIQPID